MSSSSPLGPSLSHSPRPLFFTRFADMNSNLQSSLGGPRLNYWGNEPEKEEDYYASKNIHDTHSFFHLPSNQVSLFTRSWLPGPQNNPSPPRALIFMIHGYDNDISWMFQSTPIFLAQHGYACFALDLPGHGRSQGMKAFVLNLDSVINDSISYFNTIKKEYSRKLKYFLFGESMGSTICLLIHLKDASAFHGAILAAPMCKISDSIRPKWPLPQILTFVARFFPTLSIVPTADLVDKSVKVEEKRIIARSNPMRYNGKPRLGTVLELLRVTDELNGRLSDVTIPFLVLHGSADVVTDPDVSRELYAKAKSEEKTMKMYNGMMHSLLFGETDENVDLIRKDILAWLDARSSLFQFLCCKILR